MNLDLARQLLDAFIPDLERAEAQSTAILQFLKGKGSATDEQLAPYLEQAANASNVRWRAARVRLERLLAAMEKDSEDKAKADAKAKSKEKAESEEAASVQAAKPDEEARSAPPKPSADEPQKKTQDENERETGPKRENADGKPVNQKTDPKLPTEPLQDPDGDEKKIDRQSDRAPNNTAKIS